MQRMVNFSNPHAKENKMPNSRKANLMHTHKYMYNFLKTLSMKFPYWPIKEEEKIDKRKA